MTGFADDANSEPLSFVLGEKFGQGCAAHLHRFLGQRKLCHGDRFFSIDARLIGARTQLRRGERMNALTKRLPVVHRRLRCLFRLPRDQNRQVGIRRGC